MFKKIALILLAAMPSSLFSQLYVGPDTFVFAKKNVVFVKNEVNLSATNSNFFLRNEAQLVQGTTSTSINTGLGNLSVFQEGTSNEYAYNSWCSPVGNTATTLGNSAFGITQLYSPTTKTISTAAGVVHNANYNGVSNPLNIEPYWIWKFLSASTYSQWISVEANNTILPGEGFTMKGTNGTDLTNVGELTVNNPGDAQRYDFRGRPNDGNITVNIGNGLSALTGNPYPSALHMNAFLLDPSNTNCTGIAYYWEQDKTVNSHYLNVARGGYGTYAPINLSSNGIYTPATFYNYNSNGTVNTGIAGVSSNNMFERKYAPIAQGFMLNGAANGTLTLKNSHRIFYQESNAGGLSAFNKNNQLNANNFAINDISMLRLNVLLNNQYTRQMALAFLPEATDGIDKGIDAKLFDDSLPFDAYFYINGGKYVIEGLNFDVNKRIPVGLTVNETIVAKFHIQSSNNFDESQPIYLFDSSNNSYHNIKNDSYEVLLSSGSFNERFQITFKNDTTLANNTVEVQENLQIFQSNELQLLYIQNLNLIPLSNFKLFDIAGRLVIEKFGLDAKVNEFSTATLASGAYIVKVIGSNTKIFTQKIIVKNK